jgi:hypothetical protein
VAFQNIGPTWFESQPECLSEGQFALAISHLLAVENIWVCI